MKKTKKYIIIATVSVFLVAVITASVFFAVFPLKPKVEIKSSEERINNTDSLLVASYNTAAPWGNFFEGTYTLRRAYLFAEQLNDVMPDSIGLQEFNRNWESVLSEGALPQYEYYGVERGGDSSEKTSEMNGILYLKDKYSLLESDTFWISLTPNKESRFENAGCNRTVSFVVLENKQTGFVYAHINTHLDNVSEDAQNLGAELIVKKSAEITQAYGDIPIIVTGDFNQYESGKACTCLKQNGFKNVNTENKEATYHAWGEYPHTEPIDFIFTNEKLTPSEYKVHNTKINGSFVSDHFMITAELYKVS